MTTKKESRDSCFHPFELGFCGHSNSGKTTLIEKLVQGWSHSRLHVAYLKHDNHRIEMDPPSRDTMRVGSSGASVVMFNDGEKIAHVSPWPNPPLSLSRPYFHRDNILELGEFGLHRETIASLVDRRNSFLFATCCLSDDACFADPHYRKYEPNSLNRLGSKHSRSQLRVLNSLIPIASLTKTFS